MGRILTFALKECSSHQGMNIDLITSESLCTAWSFSVNALVNFIGYIDKLNLLDIEILVFKYCSDLRVNVLTFPKNFGVFGKNFDPKRQ